MWQIDQMDWAASTTAISCDLERAAAKPCCDTLQQAVFYIVSVVIGKSHWKFAEFALISVEVEVLMSFPGPASIWWDQENDL